MSAQIIEFPSQSQYLPRNDVVVAERILTILEKARRSASLYELGVRRSIHDGETSYSQYELAESSGHESGLLEAIYIISQMIRGLK